MMPEWQQNATALPDAVHQFNSSLVAMKTDSKFPSSNARKEQDTSSNTVNTFMQLHTAVVHINNMQLL